MSFDVQSFLKAIGPSASIVFADWIFMGFLQQRYDTDSRQVEERGRALLAEIEADHERGWAELTESWRRTVEEARAEIDAINREAGRLFPAWDDPAWQDWEPGAAPPPVLRFGDYRVSRGDVPDALPEAGRLRGLAVDDFTLPALAPFPDHYSMLFRAHDAGRETRR